MGFRFRKSMKIAPGIRLNISNKSAGISFGGKGLRHSVRSTGRQTTSVGVPGTGISYVHTHRVKQKTKSTSTPTHSVWYWLLIGWWLQPCLWLFGGCFKLTHFIFVTVKSKGE